MPEEKHLTPKEVSPGWASWRIAYPTTRFRHRCHVCSHEWSDNRFPSTCPQCEARQCEGDFE